MSNSPLKIRLPSSPSTARLPATPSTTPCAPSSIALLDRIARDDAIRAVVLTGQGKAFCAGGDITRHGERMSAPAGEIAFNGWRRQQRMHHAHAALHTMPKPTIAAVNGPAPASAATWRWPATSSSQRLRPPSPELHPPRPRSPTAAACTSCRAGSAWPSAKELIFTGRKVDADGGAGARHRRPHDHARHAAGRRRRPGRASFSQGSPAALALAKTILNQSFELPVEQVFAQGSQAQAICYTTTRAPGVGRGLPGQVAPSRERAAWSAIARLLQPAQRRRHRRLGRPGQDCRPPGRPTCRSTASPATSTR